MSQGFLVKACAAEETTHQTAVAVTDQLPLRTENIIDQVLKVQSEYLDGKASVPAVRNSAITVAGDLELSAVYDTIAGDPFGVDLLYKAALGAAAYGTDYLEITPTLQLDNHLSLAFNKGVSIWEIVSGKISSLEISGQTQQPVVIKASVIASLLRRTGDAGIVNNSTTMNAVAPTTNPTEVFFDDLIFRIDDHGAALAAADQGCINRFTLTIDNNLEEPKFCTPLDGGNAVHAVEPIRNGKRSVRLTVEYLRYESDDLFSDLNANTAKQIDLKFTNGSNELNIYLPNCYVESAPAPVTGAEAIKQTVTFIAVENGSTNTDMESSESTAITDEIMIETKNARTAAP